MNLYLYSLLHMASGLGHFVVMADAVSSINTSIQNVIGKAQLIGSAVCAGMLCVGGFSYATCSGNPIKMERAKHTMSLAAVGFGIVMMSWVLGELLKSAIVVS